MGPALQAFRVEPDRRARVWGGRRLGDSRGGRIGEAWFTGPDATVGSGPAVGRRLGELAADLGAALIGTTAPRAGEIPFLIKLLDPADWLSVQIHPDDAAAVTLEGPGAVGKTEAWYCLEARPDAELLLGVLPDVGDEQVRDRIARGDVTAVLRGWPLSPGDAYLVEAGVLHAVGPGALIYEIQQQSDITYRVDDWGRPAAAGRALHVRQALASLDLTRRCERRRLAADHVGCDPIVVCEHFVLEVLDLRPGEAARCDPAGRSLHVLTGVSGSCVIAGDAWAIPLAALETVLVPAAAGTYEVRAGRQGASRVLRASLPDRPVPSA
jgi:mannose-6-phosphate isomerase